VFDEIDIALTALLTAALPGGTAVRPGARRDEPGIGLLLHDVREDITARASLWQDVHDDRGHVTGRLPPVRRYRLRYLLVATAPDAAAEHAWLGRVLVALAGCSVVPAEHLTGALGAAGLPVPLQVAPPDLPAVSPGVLAEVGARTTVELVVIAPCARPARTDLQPAPDTVSLGVSGQVPAARPRGRSAAPPRRRITEGRDG
jgi:hypothetical protein